MVATPLGRNEPTWSKVSLRNCALDSLQNLTGCKVKPAFLDSTLGILFSIKLVDSVAINNWNNIFRSVSVALTCIELSQISLVLFSHPPTSACGTTWWENKERGEVIFSW